MPKMQLVNAVVNLGGDNNNQVPKFGLTVSEVAVLRAIHGDDAVVDIAPVGEVERTYRAEIERLTGIFFKMGPNGVDSSPVPRLFPGAAARVFETLDELGLEESLYAASYRSQLDSERSKSMPAEEAPAEADDGYEKLNKADLVALAETREVVVSAKDTKAEIIAALRASDDAKMSLPDDGDDGIADMDDGLFK